MDKKYYQPYFILGIFIPFFIIGVNLISMAITESFRFIHLLFFLVGASLFLVILDFYIWYVKSRDRKSAIRVLAGMSLILLGIIVIYARIFLPWTVFDASIEQSVMRASEMGPLLMLLGLFIRIRSEEILVPVVDAFLLAIKRGIESMPTWFSKAVAILAMIDIALAFISEFYYRDIHFSFSRSLLQIIAVTVLVIFFSAVVTAFFRQLSLPAYLLSIFLLSIANIILVSEVAGIFNLLPSRLFFMGAHLLLAGGAFFIWKQKGHPPLFEPIRNTYVIVTREKISKSIRQWPDVWRLALFVTVLYTFNAYLVLNVPPNNWDAITSHMTRIGYWLQNGNFLPWETWDYTQQVYPINAQVLIMWTMLFWGWDQFAGFIQWAAAVLGVLAVYGLARTMGWNRHQAIYAGLLWALLPLVVLQSTTVQNHLVAATLFVIALYFLFVGVCDKDRFKFILSGLALALSLGTHQLVFFILPGFLIMLFLLLWKYGIPIFRNLFFFGVVSALFFLLVGSYMYHINFYLYGNPFSMSGNGNPFTVSGKGPSVLASEDDTKGNNLGALVKKFPQALVINSSRYLYTSIQFDGLPFADVLYRYRAEIGKQVFTDLGIPIEANRFLLTIRHGMSENTSWFGIIGSPVLILIGLIQLIQGFKTKDPKRISIVVMCITYMGVWSGFVVGVDGNWSVYQGRYYIILAAIAAPFLACLLQEKPFLSLLNTVIVAVSIIIAVNATFYNYNKPLIGSRAIWDLERNQMQIIAPQPHLDAFHFVEEFVPANATLGLDLVQDMYEYPFFGKYLTRKLVPIYPETEKMNGQWIKEQGIEWIFTCNPLPTPGFLEVARFPGISNIDNAANTITCRLIVKQ